MAETQRPILEQITDMVKGNVVPDSETLQALKNAFPTLADDLDNMDKLTPAYIKKVLIPAIKVLKQEELIILHQSLKTKSELKSLVQEIHDATVYIPKDGRALPGVQNSADRIKSPLKSGYKSMESFLKSLVGIEDEKQQEETLMAEIISSANRSVAKFDQYVLRGDGQQYGDKANDWLEIDSWNTDIRRPTNDKKIRHNVENVSKASFVEVINDVVSMAKVPENTIKINGSDQKVGNGTRVEKLAYLASWMSALEEGCDTALPGLVAEAANKTAKVAVDSTVGVGADFAGGIWDEYPKTIIITGGIIAYAAYRSGGLLKGIVNAPGATVKLVGKAASFVPVVKKLAPYIEKLGTGMSVFGDRLTTPNGAPGAAAAGSPGATPEGPKTPRRFVEVNPADLKDFKPGEANHEEYYKKTVEKIKSLGVAPVAPAAGAPAPATPEEVTRRTTLFMRLDQEYRGGKMSLAEYLKRTEDIIGGRGKIVVVDNTGAANKAESVKNVKQRALDRTPGFSQFTRNNPNGSAAASVSAMQEAKKRIKGASYESVDYAGTKVEFADATNRILFEEFRDKLQKYTEMQEWDAHNRGIIALEDQVSRIKTIDIPAKEAAILAKNTQIANTPARIPGPSVTYPPATGSPPGTPGTTVPGLDIVNPDITKFNSELSLLQAQLEKLNDKISEINTEIAKKGADILPYRPKATAATTTTGAITPREQFHTDIRALKLELSTPGVVPTATTPGGLIQRINQTVGAGTIPESAFDRAALRIDKARLLEVVKTALKK